MKHTLKVLLFTLALCVMLPVAAQALEVPALKGRVNDYAGMMNDRTRQFIDQSLKALDDSDSTQVVVLTIPTLDGESLNDFSIKVVEKWKLGQKDKDNGILLLVAKKERKVRIEVGYGLEGVVTDALASTIINTAIAPNFKAGRVDEGFIEGVMAISAAVKGEYKAPKKKERRKGKFSITFLIIIIIWVIFSNIGRASRRRGDGSGLATGMIIGSMLGGGGGGGGFGGGGFSGGGGGFGGGGASGDW